MQITNVKEPWLAVWLSSICAGIGQLYSGSKQKGLFFVFVGIILDLSVLFFFVWFFLIPSKLPFILAIIMFIGAIIFSVYNLFDAFNTAKTYNETHQLNLPPRKKQPFLSLFLSSIIPGLGQFYNSQWLKGIGLFMVVIIIGGILKSIAPAGPLISRVFEGLATLWIVNDAYSQAVRMNGESSSLIEKFGQKKVLTVVIFWLLVPVILAGGLTVTIRHYFLQAYKIPADSMAPTLLKGDRLFANKWIYRFEDPKRGDLIVFKYQVDQKKDFIKRVVGLPGEKLKIENGRIYVNGELLDTPQFLKTTVYSNREDWQYGKSGQVIEIPQNSYFVIGDNPEKSVDSRQSGFVPRQFIKGKGYWIWWPQERWRKL